MHKHISHISDGLFVGSWLATKKITIDHYNINSVISVGADPDTFVKNVEYSVVHLDDNLQSVPLLIDNVLPHILPYIHERLLCGKNILIHCSAGKSRSVTIVAAYLIKYKGMTYNDAMNLIEEKRPVAYPNEGFKNVLQKMIPNDSKDLNDSNDSNVH
jgi:Dual specificity phosphatase, catalytic domain